jgi:hypothetical protein
MIARDGISNSTVNGHQPSARPCPEILPRLLFLFPEQSSHQRFFQVNRLFGAQLLAAIAADADRVPVLGWPGFVVVHPVDRLGICRAHLYAGPAFGAFPLVDDRFGHKSVAEEFQDSPGLVRLERGAVDVERVGAELVEGVVLKPGRLAAPRMDSAMLFS